MKRSPVALLLGVLLAIAAMGAAPLTIYTELSPPDQYYGADGELTGYAVELVREIQERVSSSEPIQVVPWIRGYKEAASKPNVVLFSLARTKPRINVFDWLGPIRETAYSFCVKSDSGIVLRNLDDARKLRLIGVYKEDVREQHLSMLGFTNLDRSLDETTVLRKLMDGRVDAMVADIGSLRQVAQSAGFRPEDIRETMTVLKVPVYLVFSKGTPESLQKNWAAALAALREEGALERLYRKYFPNRPPPDYVTMSP